jgi:hypothetical protein
MQTVLTKRITYDCMTDFKLVENFYRPSSTKNRLRNLLTFTFNEGSGNKSISLSPFSHTGTRGGGGV